MSRGNSLSDELDLSSVLGDTRAYLYSPGFGGSYSEPKGNSSLESVSYIETIPTHEKLFAVGKKWGPKCHFLT